MKTIWNFLTWLFLGMRKSIHDVDFTMREYRGTGFYDPPRSQRIKNRMRMAH